MKVIIYGCGRIGRRIFKPLMDCQDISVLAYTDSNEDLWGKTIYNTLVIAPWEIEKYEYDQVLIASYDLEFINQIYKRLLQIKIPADKIKAVAFETDFFEVLMDTRTRWICDFAKWSYEEERDGNVAECGVFRGDTAKYINLFFPDRTLYLFDTFDGFDEKDIEYEKSLDNIKYNESKFVCKDLFAHTDVELVMKKMRYPENIRIHKGYFPKTAKGINDSFLFVHLDMDLYIPMLEGLRFFWRRMVKGGCILLHDYFYEPLPGVKKAVKDFEKENGVVDKLTIGDGGSLALIK